MGFLEKCIFGILFHVNGSLLYHLCYRHNHDSSVLCCFRSESPSQVFMILLQWLLALMQLVKLPSKVVVAYDNMCNLAKLKIARNPLPFPPPLDKVWHNVDKIIDSFHIQNHVSQHNYVTHQTAQFYTIIYMYVAAMSGEAILSMV